MKPTSLVAFGFAVSGGGTVKNSEAHTDTTGLATAGGWTLGGAAGLNVIVASIAQGASV